MERDKWFLNSPSKWNMLKGLKNIYDWYLILTFPKAIFLKVHMHYRHELVFFWRFSRPRGHYTTLNTVILHKSVLCFTTFLPEVTILVDGLFSCLSLRYTVDKHLIKVTMWKCLITNWKKKRKWFWVYRPYKSASSEFVCLIKQPRSEIMRLLNWLIFICILEILIVWFW